MTTIATHNGTFHADDVFAVAILLLLEPDAKVIRTREENLIDEADYVVDVGFIYDPKNRRFDHHQQGGAGIRENGIQYASFGLVWKEYGEKLAGGEKQSQIIDKILAQPLDAHDNGIPIAEYRFDNIRSYTIVDFFYSFLIKADETEENLFNIFMNNVELATSLLKREIEKAKNTVMSEESVTKIYESSQNKQIIELDKDYRWHEVLMNKPEPVFVIYPRNAGDWGVKAVPSTTRVFGQNRKNLPEEWGGKINEELQKITGVKDAIFAHRGLFMAAAKTKEGAVELAYKALNA
jgi:uncharacterized UPF0160 family protein